MAAALPVTKLASLLLKTLSKPMAKRIKHEASRYPWSQRLLINVGQTTHTITSRMTIWSAGYKVRSITPLEPDKALVNGAELLGEVVVFSVSGVLVVYEYNRSKTKEKQKEEQKLAEMQAESDHLQAKLHSLDVRLKALEKVVKNNTSSILQIPFREKYVEPTDIVSIDERSTVALNGKTIEPSKKSNDISASSSAGGINNETDTTPDDSPRRQPWWRFWRQ
uniref:OPA3-like protein n=1 Tax=Attheya septentrionalis TaxID=420275 RepID=A0A7S2UM42_9STRA|mmetsp:Transcript_28137/g.51247  ORF Transcript_28137/g.51247 Transcript_28137/m.51247 type:complete len:222 (+) Transcript_28137:168-833(+)|eukprot:CAMPEP_0198296832 /NCGR_PEP_ID=MMETSP1449-20131203/34188_1 /TAXON_ID=420275 /ORGANISM="Attheya septentrionalis, Strain CCMP2084" /LENGTH=221 /DNA_ID=CAMNT_0043997563 /DNA_START=166 /DNA_END=831 /DNA_ORIENTATION=+